MKKSSLQKTKKLRLSTETLRQLSSSDLAVVAGGVGNDSKSACESYCNCPKPNPY